MTQDIGGINYKESHAMVYGNKAYIEKGANDYNNYLDILTYNNEDKKYTNDEIEAFIIAKDIKKKIEEKYLVFDFDKECNRDVTYNDFCILLRSANKNCNIYSQEFLENGIPFWSENKENFLKTSEISTIFTPTSLPNPSNSFFCFIILSKLTVSNISVLFIMINPLLIIIFCLF